MVLTAEQKHELKKLSISDEGIFWDEKYSNYPLDPTIVIGIGGLGCETLSIMKKKLVANTGNIPNIKFLAIDSDEKDLHSHKFLDEGEVLSLYDSSISDIFRDNRRNIPLNIDKEILRELPETKIDNTGARGIRQICQLMLRCGSAYQRLKAKILQMIAAAEAASFETKRQRPEKYEIILIAGVSGGTGGGTLIDIAYLVHRIMAETYRNNYSCSSYIYTPDVQLSESTYLSPTHLEYLKRNGYETMKEIDYYMNLVSNHGEYSIHTGYEDFYKAKCNVFTDCTIVTGNMQPKQSAVSRLSDALTDYFSDSEIHSKLNLLGSNRVSVFESWQHSIGSDETQFPKEANYSFRVLDYSAVSVSTNEFRTYFIGKVFQTLYEKLTHADKVDNHMVVQSVLSKAHLKNAGMLSDYARSIAGGIMDMSVKLQPDEYPSKSAVRDGTDMTYELCQRYAKRMADRISEPSFKERLKQEIMSIVRTQIDDIFNTYGPYYVVELITRIIEVLNVIFGVFIEQANKKRVFATCAETKGLLQQYRDAATSILAGRSKMKSYVDFNREIAAAIFDTTFYDTLAQVVQEITVELAHRDKAIWEVHADTLTEISKILENDVHEIINTQRNATRFGYNIFSLSEDRSEKLRRYLDALADSHAVDFLFRSFGEKISWNGANRFEFNITDSSVPLAEIRSIFTNLVREFLGTGVIEKFATVAYSPHQLYQHDIDYIWVNNGMEKSRALKDAAMEIFQIMNRNNDIIEGMGTAFWTDQLISTRTLVTLDNASQLSKELSVLNYERGDHCSEIRSKVLNKYVSSRIIWNVSLYMIRGFREYEQEHNGNRDIYIRGHNNQKNESARVSTIEEILTLSFSKNGKNKRLHVTTGDICDITDSVDLLVCSAFKNNYAPSPGTLIGALYYEKNISVYELSEKPELDLRNVGCWLSEKTGTNFSRIACVELLPLGVNDNVSDTTEKLLRSTFSTLRFLIEHACIDGISVRNIVMPILGTGNQRIDINYVAPVLLSQMRQALQSIDQLTDIYIYERNPDKARELSEILSRILESDVEESPDVFISYSSKQDILAHSIFNTLTQKGISCWIAPESIPPGSNYIDEISEGLGITQVTVLVLTPDAERSRWVKKEIGASIGAGHIIIPYQKEPYEIGSQFRFLLDGEQILEAWKQSGDKMEILADTIMNKLKDISVKEGVSSKDSVQENLLH